MRPPCEGGSERFSRAGGLFFAKTNPPLAFGSRPPSQGVDKK
jgi:hypothetical protein